MSDESLEVEVKDVDPQEVKEPEVEAPETEDEAKEPSDTDKEAKEESGESEPTEAEKIKHAMQKRLDRKTAIEKQQAEELETLRKQIEELKPKEQDTAPKEDDFETYEEWQDAVIEHRAEERLKQKELEMRKQQMERKQQEARETAQKRFETAELEFKSQHPEYEDNAKQFMDYAQDLQKSKGNTPTLQAIGQVLTELDDSPALINHLGQNEDFAYELSDLSPVQAAFKLFELSQTLKAPPQQENTKPAPVKSLKGSGTAAKSLAQSDGKAILQWLNK